MAEDVSRIIIEFVAIDYATDKIEGLMHNVTSLPGLFGVAATAATAMGAGVVAGLGASVKAASDLQSVIANLQVQTGASDAAMGQFKETAQELQSSIGANMEQMAMGFLHAHDVTQDATTSIAELTVATKAAVASQGDAGEYTNLLATTMREYGLDVDKVTGKHFDLNKEMDISNQVMGQLIVGARDANATLPQFEQYLSRVASQAAAMNVPLQDVEASIGALTRHGFAPDIASTQVRGILAQLDRKPTKDRTAELAKLDESAGLGNQLEKDVSAEGLARIGITGVLDELRAAYTKLGYTQDQVTASASKLITAQRGGIGLSVLLTTATSDYAAILADLGDQQKTGSAVTDILATQQGTLKARIADLRGEITVFGQQIGTGMLPMLTQWVVKLDDLLKPIGEGLPTGLTRLQDVMRGGAGRDAYQQKVGITGDQMQAVSLDPIQQAFVNIGHGIAVARDTVKTFFMALNGGWKDNDQIVGVTRVFGNFGTILRDIVIPSAKNMASVFVVDILPSLVQTGSTIVTVSAFLREHENIVRSAIAAYAVIRTGLTAYQTTVRVVTAVQTAFNAVLDANPIGLIVLAIAALAAAFYELYTHNQAFHDFINGKVMPALKDLGNWIVSNVIPALQQMGTWIGDNVVPRLQQFGVWVGDNIVPKLQQFGQWIGPRLVDAGRATWNWITGTAIPGLERFAEWLGPRIANAAQAAARYFTNDILPAARAVGSWITGTGIPAFQSVAAHVAAFGDAIATKLAPVLRQIGVWINENVMPQLHALGGWFQTTIMPLLQAFGDFVKTIFGGSLIPDFGLLGDAVRKLADIFGVNLKPAIDLFRGLWNDAKDILGTFATYLKSWIDIFKGLWETIEPIVQLALLAVAGVIKVAIDQWWPIVKAGVEVILNVLHLAWDTMDKAVRVAWDVISTVIDDVLNNIKDYFKLWTDLLKGNWSGVWNDLKDMARNVWDIIHTVIADALGLIKNTISNVLATIKDSAGDILTGLWTMVKNLFNDGKDALGITMGAVHDVITGAWNGIKDFFKAGKDDMVAAIKLPFEVVRDTIGAIISAIKDNLSKPWNLMADGINGFIGGVVKAVSWIGDKLHVSVLADAGTPFQVPKFASGGVTEGGPIIAGEKGEELLMPPKGTRVFSAQETIDIFKAVAHRQPEGAPMVPGGGFLGVGAGNPFSYVGDKVKDFTEAVAGEIRSFVAQGAEKIWGLAKQAVGLKDITGAGMLAPIATGLGKTLGDAALDAVKNLMSGVKDALHLPRPGARVALR
jgi:TP901 family phage tail tape measure protein